MSAPFDKARMALTYTAPQPDGLPPRHRRGERFLKGPIPWLWLELAGALPGKALHVAVALWYRAGLERTDTVVLSSSRLAGMGIDRYAVGRALRALEGADLILVERHDGRAARVTILSAPRGAR